MCPERGKAFGTVPTHSRCAEKTTVCTSIGFEWGGLMGGHLSQTAGCAVPWGQVGVGGEVIFSRHESPSGLLAAVLAAQESGQRSLYHCCPPGPQTCPGKRLLPSLKCPVPAVLPDKLCSVPLAAVSFRKPLTRQDCLLWKRLALEARFLITSSLDQQTQNLSSSGYLWLPLGPRGRPVTPPGRQHCSP